MSESLGKQRCKLIKLKLKKKRLNRADEIKQEDPTRKTETLLA